MSPSVERAWIEIDECFWTNEMVYHFEKYDLKLNEGFIKYVLKRS